MRTTRGGADSRTAPLHRTLRLALVAGVFAGPAALFAACGGTTGREGLPAPEAGSPDATLSDRMADGVATEADASGGDAAREAEAGPDATTPDGDEGTFDVVILYADRPLPDVAAPVDSGAPDGARDAAVVPEDGSACIVNNTPLALLCPAGADAGSPCGHGGRCDSTLTCVDGGPPPPVPCTPTEQKFVDYSLDCYNCLVAPSAACLDNPISGIIGQECQDLTGSVMTGPATGQSESDVCLANIDCILGMGNGCASSDVSPCYCGTLAGSLCSTSLNPGNGLCDQVQASGVGHFVTDPASVVSPLLADFNHASGRADAIFSCAAANNCTSLCQRDGGN